MKQDLKQDLQIRIDGLNKFIDYMNAKNPTNSTYTKSDIKFFVTRGFRVGIVDKDFISFCNLLLQKYHIKVNVRDRGFQVCHIQLTPEIIYYEDDFKLATMAPDAIWAAISDNF